jgi:hypothetical protein
MADRTTPDDETEAAEVEDASVAHGPDRTPTTDEEAAADRAREDPEIAGDPKDVAAHYEEMAERGVEQKGEGRIT